MCLALAGLVASGCAEGASTASRQATAPEPTTTTVAALDVAETGFPVTTTSAVPAPATRPCDAPPDAEIVPGNAQVRCDASAGWRLSTWIGESGDGIVYLERHLDRVWVVVAHGPYCGGVAAIPVPELVSLGLPADLAEAWGVEALMCADPAPYTAARGRL